MTGSWGTWGSATQHQRYMEPLKSRKKCHCGCGGYVTAIGMANGVGLYWGCELSVRRWVRDARSTYITK